MVKIADNKIEDQFSTLLNPEQRIPQFISGLTGINEVDVQEANTFSEIANQVSDFIGDHLLIAHNALFDISFLNQELTRSKVQRRLTYACSVRLSRKLYPNYRKHGLDSIVSRLNIQVENRHRALDDALVIKSFLDQAYKDFTKEYVLTLIDSMSRDINSNLKYPQSPGIYIFRDENNYPVYVGKSINLRSRINSHLHNGDDRILKAMHKIEVLPTAGEFSALIDEVLAIKNFRPVYNKLLRKKESFYILERSYDSMGYIQMLIKEVADLDFHNLNSVYAIFYSKNELLRFLRTKAEEHMLCHKYLGLEKSKGSCFAFKLGKCNGACNQNISAADHNHIIENVFAQYKLQNWPWQGAITITEKREEITCKYSFDDWCLIGSKQINAHVVTNTAEYEKRFDFDIYRILQMALKKMKHLDIKEHEPR